MYNSGLRRLGYVGALTPSCPKQSAVAPWPVCAVCHGNSLLLLTPSCSAMEPGSSPPNPFQTMLHHQTGQVDQTEKKRYGNISFEVARSPEKKRLLYATHQNT